MKHWSLDKHLERAKFYLAERADRRLMRRVLIGTRAFTAAVVIACGWAVVVAVWG